MIRRLVIAVTICFVTLIRAPAEAVEFTDMVHDLTVLQGRMVMGDQKARDLVARQFDAIELKIPELGPDEWILQKNTRAAIVYLLGGGSAATLRELHEAGFFAPEDSSLVEAALNHAEGDRNAGTRLAVFDPKAYPPILGGHLALVQGNARIMENKEKAIVSFDLARLFMPASLVEEAALRRELRVLDPEKSADKIASLARIYAERYHASPYAGNFWTELRGLIFGPSGEADFRMATQLAAAIDLAPVAEQFGLKAALFRSAFLKGQINDANHWLEKAAVAASGAEQNLRRVAFYRAMMAAVDPRHKSHDDKQKFQLATPPDPEDQALKEITAAVVNRIEIAREEEPNAADEAPADTRSQMVNAAHVLFDEVDALLKKRERK
jgi:chemotaxis protein MotC